MDIKKSEVHIVCVDEIFFSSFKLYNPTTTTIFSHNEDVLILTIQRYIDDTKQELHNPMTNCV